MSPCGGSYTGLHTVRRMSLFLSAVILCLLGPGANSLCPSRKAPYQLYLQSFFLQDWYWELYLQETRDCSACYSPLLDMYTKSFYYSFSGTCPPNKQIKAKKFQQKYKCQSSYPSIHQLCVNPNLDSSWIPAHIKKVTSLQVFF